MVCSVLVWADKVDIVADRFDSDTKKQISTFYGNVSIIKGDDALYSQKLVVYTDKKNHPIKYEATKKVKFTITALDKNATYTGSANTLLYFPKENNYELYTNVVIKQIGTSRTIRGDKVLLNAKTGSSKVIGKKKEPIHITFDVGE